MRQIKIDSFADIKKALGNARLTNHASQDMRNGISRTVAFYYRENENEGMYEHVILDIRTDLNKASQEITLNIYSVYDDEDRKLFCAAIDGLAGEIIEMLSRM